MSSVVNVTDEEVKVAFLVFYRGLGGTNPAWKSFTKKEEAERLSAMRVVLEQFAYTRWIFSKPATPSPEKEDAA